MIVYFFSRTPPSPTQLTTNNQQPPMPYTHLSLSLNPHEADLQLQHAVKMSAAALDSAVSSHSAKRSHSDTRAAQDDDYSYNSSSEFLSDDSGRFDDADESEHSAKKRRRDNGWPFNGLGSADNSPSRRRRRQQQHRRRKSGHRATSHSPRSSSSSVGREERPRRSRFVEERMCDSVSERPPSIFTGDNNARAESRQSSRSSSGIFRFGRAIAAAFNPFGNSWRTSTSSGENDAEMRSRDEDIARVERAYEELKRAGYKGTAKGSYTQQAAAAGGNGGNRVDSATADQTWKTIQDKLEGSEPPASGRQSRQDSSGSTQFSSSATPSRRDSGTLFRSSLQDLRRAKSSLAIPTSIRRSDAQAEAGECSEVRRKKSRKELQKQAKLIKRVSNLEEKLERARRELREVAGDEETEGDGDGPKSLCMDNRAHPRKFVPGALPTLPSERLLDAHAASASPEPMPRPEHPAFTAPSPNIHQIAESHEETHHGDLAVKKQRSTPKPPKKLNDQSLAATDSPPLKRKSPDPASAADGNGKPSWSVIPTQTPSSSSRKPKHPKTGKRDSPTAAEVKQSSSSSSSQSKLNKPVKHRRPSPPPTQRTTMMTTKSSPRLRMRKARSDLRSATGPESPSVDTNDDEPSNEASSKPLPGPGPAGGRRRTPSQDQDHDYVPPVPPIPKDIVAATAKVDSGRSFKEREMRSAAGAKDRDSVSSPSGSRARRVDEEFRWPEEFF